MKKNKGKVMVAMSGGIDSAVAALLLADEGYEVIGLTMKTWDYASSGGKKKETGCCSLDSINDARALAVKENFPHYILDIRNEFTEHVITNFVDEYLAGRTPNPCILCNTHIKWGALLQKAGMLDCEFIATGHYAQVRKENDRYVLSQGVDKNKDQSYVLWGLSQESLARTIFPLGKLTKPEVKKMAAAKGYKEIADKSESFEICFVPDNDYREFLVRNKEDLSKKVTGGDFVDTGGKPLGKHRGYPFYTIGQRKGLEIALGEPMYVTEILPDTNTVVLGKKEELKKQLIWVGGVNSIKYPKIPEGINAVTKIRYKDIGVEGQLYHDSDRIRVEFSSSVNSIAPGQSAVFYENNDVIGGGIIQ